MSDLAQLENLAARTRTLRDAVAKRVVGQTNAVDATLTALFAGGHALLIGVPGLAKSLLVKSLAECLAWKFRRIQFTPDLMPSDITGTEILREDKLSGNRELAFVPGPVFGNLVLADEINRAPPKTQAALLEAMQERSVTVGGTTHALPAPFFVLATQNPIEQEGTYPLPEAQLDRFLLAIRLGYPSLDEELAIATLDLSRSEPLPSVLSVADYTALAALVARIPVPDIAARHAVALTRASRPGGDHAWINENVAWGAGPRATQALISAAKAHAALHGLPAVGIAEVRAVAPLVLAHRVVPSFAAAGTGIDGQAIVARLVQLVGA